MLFLLFHLDSDCYALDSLRIEELIPVVHAKQLPGMPPAISGVIDYHGTPVPLLDVSELALGRSARRRTTTRIAVVRHRDDHGSEQLLGLLLERAVEMFRCDPAEFRATGVDNQGTPYLGPVTAGPSGLVQWVSIDALLTPEVARLLFHQAVVTR